MGESLRQYRGGVGQLIRRHDPIYQPKPERLGGNDEIANEEKLQRLRGSDQLSQ